jgi:hypothetical protein
MVAESRVRWWESGVVVWERRKGKGKGVRERENRYKIMRVGPR